MSKTVYKHDSNAYSTTTTITIPHLELSSPPSALHGRAVTTTTTKTTPTFIPASGRSSSTPPSDAVVVPELISLAKIDWDTEFQELKESQPHTCIPKDRRELKLLTQSINPTREPLAYQYQQLLIQVYRRTCPLCIKPHLSTSTSTSTTASSSSSSSR